jgi:nicotinamidase-related amidase
MMVLDKKDRKIALVVVDVQKKFLGNGETEIRKNTAAHLGTINEAISLFEKAAVPVIYIKYDDPCECVVYDGKDGDDYVDGLLVASNAIEVHKHHMNSFRESKLADIVKETGCDNILVCGLVSQYCVIATYYGAYDYDLTSYMLKNGTIAISEEQSEMCEKICKIYSIEDIKENLKNRAAVPKPAEKKRCCCGS